MNVLRVAAILLFLKTGCRGATDLSHEQINTILEAHNYYRKAVNPTATNMEHMEWDDSLATIAQGWADGCDFTHNSHRGDGYAGSVGENIYADTGSYTAGSETENWNNEVSDYTYSSNSCRSGAVCGHYTQVVWATSKKLGCGVKLCSTLGTVNWSNANLVVCNYAPSGNFVGQKPYISGIPCTQCANGNDSCADNLCGPTTPAPICNALMDLFFVLDGSGSVTDANFDKMKQFAKNVVNAFDISASSTRVGVVQYSDSNTLEFNLGDHADKPSTLAAIDSIVYQSGGTRTGSALEFARVNAAWRGESVPKVMIVVTDGKSGDSVTSSANNLASQGVDVYAIGVGNYRSTQLLEIAAGNQNNVIELTDFNALSAEIEQIAQAVCVAVDHCRPDPCINGTCSSGADNFTCTCDDGYGGETCQTPVAVDHCQSDPCINGTCSSGPDNFTCTCDDGFEGETCQTPVALVVVSADLTLAGEVFTDDLNDMSHPRFQMLARAIELETSLAFAEVPNFRKATVTRFRMGSVVATVDMEFRNTGQAPGSDEVVMTGILQEHIKDNGGRLGNLSVSQVDAVLSPVYCKEEFVETEAGLVYFPRADGDSFSYSAERCNSSAENEKPLATRFCRITTGRTAVWDPPVLLTCETDLRNLSQIVVTNDTALSVAAEVQVITIQAETLSSNDVASISTILQQIVNVSATEQIGDSLLTTVDNLINVNVTVLQQSQQERRGPTRVVQALEAFADTVALTTEKYTAVRPGVALQAADISPDELDKGQGFAFFLSGQNSNNLKEGRVRRFTTKDGTGFLRTADIAIYIPPNISSMVQINNTSEVRLSYTLYNSSSLFVQTSQGAAGPSQDAVGTRVIGGRIAGRRVKNLPEPVIITFAPLQNFLPEDVKGVRCVFWDFEAEAGQGAWSTEGCESTGEENGLYTCACNHLTNFAAIFDVFGGGFGVHERPLEVITIVGCAVSIVCLVLTLLSFVVTRNYKRRASTGHARNQRLVLINLCVALLAILVIFLAGINQTASPIGCTVVAAFLHYFLLAALVWMAVEAVNIYLAVVVVFNHHVSENFVIRAAAVAWGFPLVATVLTVGPSSLFQYRMKNNCWLAQTPLIYAFLIPAGLILLFNLLVFVIVMCKLVRDEKELKQLRGAKVQEADRYWIIRQIRRAFSIMALFGLTWLFGFFVINDARAVFAYLFCIFNTLQGLFIFIFHCVMREDMKKWWRKLRHMAVPCSYSGGKKRGLYDVSGRRTSFSSTSVQTSQTTLVRLSSFSYNSKPDVGPL